MQQKHYMWLAAAVGLALGVGGWLLFAPKAAAPGPQATSTPSTTGSSTLIDLGGGNFVRVSGDAKVEMLGNGSVQPPAINRPQTLAMVATSTFSADVQAALRSQVATYVSELTAAPTRTDLWLKFGMVRKIAGDYQGAVEAWTYVAKAGSNSINFIAYGNLGDLYLNFVRDYAKAEASYKAALAIKPGVADYIAGLKSAQQFQGK